jgi:septum formation protein
MKTRIATSTLLLASESPYRRELLGRLKIPFSSERPAMDEEALKKTLGPLAPSELAQKLALAKARSLSKSHPDQWILGSDQILCLGTQTFGKSHSREGAIQQLESLSGKTHELLTAWALVCGDQEKIGLHRSRIVMRKLSSIEIERYVDLERPFDCAGSYKMESLGISLVESIETSDFTSIVGLPLLELSRHLREIGFNVP